VDVLEESDCEKAFKSKRGSDTGGNVKNKQTVLRWALIALITTLIVAIYSSASAADGPRAIGMGGSYLLFSPNCDGAAVNPANLGLAGEGDFSLRLFSAVAQVSNNAFSLSDYKYYNGAYLSEQDKSEILAKIPNDGLTFDLNSTASALSFTFQRFALNFSAIGGGRGRFAKEPIELALMGNKVGSQVEADGSGGTGWAAASIAISHGREVLQLADWNIAAGITFKYLRGLAYYGAEGLTAQALTLATGITGEGGLTARSATGGSGYAVDLGFAARHEVSEVGLVVRNLIGAINWNKEVEERVYSFRFDNLTLENADSVWVSDEYIKAGEDFRSRPPVEMELGAARTFGRILTAVSLKQGFDETAFVSKNPRLAAGIEYPVFGFLSSRCGLAAGGNDQYSAAIGLGLKFGPFLFDTGFASAGRLFPWGGRGGQFALSTSLEF
jgi:hypothetical protein